MMFKSKPHRQIEIDNGCKRNSLKEAVEWLINNKQDLHLAVKGCADYVKVYPNIKYEVAFNMYVSILKNPKKEVQQN
jgi:hypothetical protein